MPSPFTPATVPGSGGAGSFTSLTDTLLAAPAATIDFTGISQGYLHLRIVAQVRSAKAASTSDTLRMQFNGDATAIYDVQTNTVSGGVGAAANNSGATSFNYVGQAPAASSPAGGMGQVVIDIANYAAATLRKGFTAQWIIVRADDSADLVEGICGGQWRSTAALTRVTLFFAADNLITGCRATLYGLS